jgi:serine/threonine protein kinase
MLGGTGMCRVYLAEQATGHKQFAIKVLRNANFNQGALDVVQRRFVQEARLASRLHHPHIVDVVDFGCTDGLAYLVMEYLEGESLSETLQAATGRCRGRGCCRCSCTSATRSRRRTRAG